MMGSTHYKLGVLYYILFCIILIAVPALAAVPLIGQMAKEGISIAGILVAALAALMPDMDSQHSMINRMNPVTGLANGAIEVAESVFMFIARLVFSIGIASIILLYSSHIITQLRTIEQISQYAELITYGVAGIMALSGVMGSRAISSIPIIGRAYKKMIKSIGRMSCFFKRMVTFVIYSGCGVALVYYNFTHGRNWVFYLIAVLLIATSIFPHRSFLHSIEGLVLYSICAFYLFDKVGYTYLSNAFFIGYASHLYMSDMLTKEGIPLSVIPMILKKTGIHKALKKNKVYKLLNSIIGIRLRIPLSSTGSKSGNKFEATYVFVLLVITVITLFAFGADIRII